MLSILSGNVKIYLQGQRPFSKIENTEVGPNTYVLGLGRSGVTIIDTRIGVCEAVWEFINSENPTPTFAEIFNTPAYFQVELNTKGKVRIITLSEPASNVNLERTLLLALTNGHQVFPHDSVLEDFKFISSKSLPGAYMVYVALINR